MEAALRNVEAQSEAVVHIEPTTGPAETAADAIRAVALGLGLATHHEQVYMVEGGATSGSKPPYTSKSSPSSLWKKRMARPADWPMQSWQTTLGSVESIRTSKWPTHTRLRGVT